MKRIKAQLKALLLGPLSRLQRRFQQARPGSILIMVVALLVLLALMGTAFISSARMERYSSIAGNGQRMLREAADSFAQQLFGQIQTMVGGDSGNLVTCPSDSATATQYLAARQPMLLPDLTTAYASTQERAVPIWPTVSRFAGQQFESPYKGTTYQVGAGSFLAPTNIVITYTSNGGLTDPNLVGQTLTFPAFKQFSADLTNPKQYKLISPPTVPYTAGPFLAGDSTGMGVADTAMIRLTSSPIQGVDFYGGIRVVDNLDAFNLNTAWDSSQDLDANGNCFNFFPCDLDLAGAMNVTSSPNEINAVNTRRFKTIPANTSPRFDDTTPAARNHTDVTYLNAADAFWMHIGRRPAYPNLHSLFGDQFSTPTAFARPFDDADTATLLWHGGLIDFDNPLGKYDTLMSKQAGPWLAGNIGFDSVYGGAANCVSNSQNRFRYFAANNVGYWYDWYYNFDNTQSVAGGATTFPIAALGGAAPKTFSGMPYRSLRPMVVGANPVANICRQVDFTTLPPSATKAVANPAAVVVAPVLGHPYKASLNTADFPELWRAFINVMGSGAAPIPATGMIPFSVPADDPTNPNSLNGSIFRNVLRAPTAGSTLSQKSTSLIDSASERFDSKSVLLLRAAEAAVNVMTLREGHGYSPSGTYFIPDSVCRPISLTTVSKKNVQVLVYGVTANPFIAEVYANTDQTDHGGNANDKGFVAIKLYNPYPFAIQLIDYGLAVVDRNSSGTYPNMKVTQLQKLNVAGAPTIAANSTVLLTNFSQGGGNPNVKFWPKGTGLGGVPGANVIVVPDLHLVFNDPTIPGSGGELVLLRKLQHNGAGVPEVPVDCYDFTGLALTPPPKGGNATATVWHYVRTIGNTKAANRGKCVYPGIYDATQGNGSPGKPRFIGSNAPVTYDPSGTEPPTTTAANLNSLTAPVTGSYTNPFPGIELCNADMGGFNKFRTNTPRTFPFGGFARVGDVIQAPFIGSYVVENTAQAVNLLGPSPLGTFPATVMEINPVTVDTCMADDGDQGDDAQEQIGRFVPIYNTSAANQYDDYSIYGYYQQTNPNTVNPPNGIAKSLWRYHFANGILDQFTVVSNPESDYFPNMHPVAWHATPIATAVAPTPVPNSTATATTPNLNNEFVTEGLVNVNSASWRTLAAMELLPASVGNLTYPGANPATLTYNQVLAKLIVRYRDVDDGLVRKDASGNPLPPQGHGAFNSLLELNKVFDPSSGTNAATGWFNKTFQNGLGRLTNAGDPTYYKWGNYAPGPSNQPGANAAKNNIPLNDYLPNTLMVSRVSNMLTLRSDSFTAYVIVQGWRNAGTAFPELVLQKRMAAIIDRSALGTLGGSVRTYNIPTD